MSELAIGLDFGAIDTRTRRSMIASGVVHLILLVWLVLHQTVAVESTGLTEITWIEAPAPPTASNAAPPVATKESNVAETREVATKPATVTKKTEQFKRELKRAEVAPKPQSSSAVADVMAQRLETLQRNSSETTTRMAALVPPPRVGQPSLAGAPSDTPVPSAPSQLQRADVAPRGAPVDLMRASANTPAPVAAVLPTKTGQSSKPAQLAKSNAKRNLAGAQLVGPVADRALVDYAAPGYPEWAKRDGVEAAVTLYFFVLANGRVKENILIEKTSGFQDFDNNAVAALRNWRFEKLAGGTADQWGRITFNFRLSDAR